MSVETGLYSTVVEYVNDETVFDRKTGVPDVDMESTCFVSYEKGYVLQIRPDIDSVAIEYGLGFANSETDSGLNYIRTVDSRGEADIESLEGARKFLNGINSRNSLASD